MTSYVVQQYFWACEFPIMPIDYIVACNNRLTPPPPPHSTPRVAKIRSILAGTEPPTVDCRVSNVALASQPPALQRATAEAELVPSCYIPSCLSQKLQ